MSFVSKTNRLHTILRALPCNFKVIQDKLEESLVQKTFKRDLEDIAELYGIVIEYNISKKQYEINRSETQLNQSNNTFFDYLQYKMKVNDNNREYVHFEQQNTTWLHQFDPLLLAVEKGLKVSFHYQRFNQERAEKRVIEPYGLKEFKQRWYLIGKKEDGSIRSYGLDRMTRIKSLEEEFVREKKFDLNRFFKGSFGIMTGDEPSERILLAVKPHQAKYLKTVPLHTSQEVVEKNEEEVIIALNLRNTYDFRMELLSMGSNVKVLEPQKLYNQMKEEVSKMMENY